MQQRAGLLFLAKNTSRVLLIYEDQKWTLPTFVRNSTLLEDSKDMLKHYSNGRIIPIELYRSQDNGFEFGTYVCLSESEFNPTVIDTLCWASLNNLPRNLHSGLKTSLNNPLILTKIETILELENATIHS